MTTQYGRSLMEDLLCMNVAYQRVADALLVTIRLEMAAREERAVFGRAGPAVLAWLRHRPRLRGPTGRLP